MFGLLRGERGHSAYRRAYAAHCSFLHSEFGVCSLPMLSYEATSLYLLGIDAGFYPVPSEAIPGCCKLQRRFANDASLNQKAMKFCANFGLLLAKIKLEDDIQDEGSFVSRIAHWKLKPSLKRATEYFESLTPDFSGRISEALAAHHKLESQPGYHPISSYVQPTSDAFSYIFKLFANHLGDDSAMANTFAEIGGLIGTTIVSFDCAVDYQRDRSKGSYNPLRGNADIEEALLFASQRMSQAGWISTEHLDASSHSARVFLNVFRRIRFIAAATERTAPKRRRNLGLLIRHGSQALRRGDCDCCCSCCDVGCCDVGCCEGASCNADAGQVCSGSDADCSVCCCNCEPCSCNSGKNKTKQDTDSTALAAKYAALIGQAGQTVGPLNPSGVVRIGATEYPAKSEHGQIDADANVVVVKTSEFGVVVHVQ